jgi:hypothetical protein
MGFRTAADENAERLRSVGYQSRSREKDEDQVTFHGDREIMVPGESMAASPGRVANQSPSALSTFSPAFSAGPLGSMASDTFSTASSTFSPAFSAGPFSRQETTVPMSGRRQTDISSDGFMIVVVLLDGCEPMVARNPDAGSHSR